MLEARGMSDAIKIEEYDNVRGPEKETKEEDVECTRQKKGLAQV
jgi:hypothetical protein